MPRSSRCASGLGEQAVGQRDDLGGRAVVADQADDLSARPALAKVQQIGRRRAGEGVDDAGDVAHEVGDVSALASDHLRVCGHRPVDLVAGGTWLGVNAFGLSVALLNRYPGTDALPLYTPPQPVSTMP